MVIVKGFDGGSAIFPCYIEGQDKTQDVNVHWKDSNDNTMYEIIAGNGTVEKQALKYKNRVQSKRGNCSVTLNKLNKTDEGNYYGYITDPLNIQINIMLIIKGM